MMMIMCTRTFRDVITISIYVHIKDIFASSARTLYQSRGVHTHTFTQQWLRPRSSVDQTYGAIFQPVIALGDNWLCMNCIFGVFLFYSGQFSVFYNTEGSEEDEWESENVR